MLHRIPAWVLGPMFQVRNKSSKVKQPKASRSELAMKAKKLVEKMKKKKPRTTFKQYNLNDGERFALCDAVR
jgi:large subunit ribosomal protein L1